MMNTTSRIYSTTDGYKYLFFDLIVLFLLLPFASLHRYLSILVSFCFLVTLLLGLNTLAFSKRSLFLFRIFASLAFISDVVIFPNSEYLTTLSSLMSYSFNSIFFGLVILAIGSRISREEKVNLNVVRGGVCIYLLLGILWFFFYKILIFFDGNAFYFPENITQNSLFYFSFTTLTTLGYGDILPKNAFAMTFANAEALVGQIYPAVVIAKLVSLYEHKES
ncbi:potassium channel family protein [Crocosphaera sp. Alani8]|uniref:potassium channel family protein n=1 Tax=Crocosphaera sp. Alani8 TaxID=3038952 RepID=UPI00313D9B99